jgi:predicted N-acyltransferase
MKRPAIELEIYHGLGEINPQEWDLLSRGQPFQGYRWYTYGEKVLTESGDQAYYLILRRDGKPIARAAFWWISNEPLPIPFLPLRKALESFQRRWPLLICRSPLANTSGLILPEAPLRGACLELINQAAQQELQRKSGSFLIFDFLETTQLGWPDWPREFQPTKVSDPGTWMDVTWDDFGAYLESGNKKDRQHYKRSLRLAEETGLVLTRPDAVSDMETALNLIHGVEARHQSAPNPWFRGMLEHMHMVDSIWLEVHQEQRLVGCGLLLRDEKVQYATALGLAENIPNVYFLLIYATLQIAFEEKVRRIHLGSGAYDVKSRLGFSMETNNNSMFTSSNTLIQRLANRLIGSI